MTEENNKFIENSFNQHLLKKIEEIIAKCDRTTYVRDEHDEGERYQFYKKVSFFTEEKLLEISITNDKYRSVTFIDNF